MGNQLFELKDSELEKISAGDMLAQSINVGTGIVLGLPGVGPLAVNSFISKCLDIIFYPIERFVTKSGNLTDVQKFKGVLKNDIRTITVTGAVSGILTSGAIGACAAKLGYDYGQKKSKEK